MGGPQMTNQLQYFVFYTLGLYGTIIYKQDTSFVFFYSWIVFNNQYGFFCCVFLLVTCQKQLSDVVSVFRFLVFIIIIIWGLMGKCVFMRASLPHVWTWWDYGLFLLRLYGSTSWDGRCAQQYGVLVQGVYVVSSLPVLWMVAARLLMFCFWGIFTQNPRAETQVTFFVLLKQMANHDQGYRIILF